MCVRLCSREARRLQASLLGGLRQEHGGTHPLVWGQSAREREGRVGGVLVAQFPHMVGSQMDCSLSHLLSSLPLCKWWGVPKFYSAWW